MRRLFFGGLVLFFFAPLFVAAQVRVEVARQYCPNPSQIFTGVASNYGGNPKIELAVDPGFNEQMKRERFTPDLPVSPIYDLIVTVVPHINEYCLMQFDANGNFLRNAEPPKTLPFAAHIELAGKPLISAYSLSWSGKKDDAGLPLYEWKIKGWKNGIVSESKMERLIRAVHDNDPSIKLVVQAKLPDGTRVREEKGVAFELCVPVSGNGTHQVVYDRVAHRLSDFMYQSDSIVSQGFLKIDPFKAYQKEFTHLVNLRNYQGKSWFNIHEAAKKGKLTIAQDCGNDKASHISISPLVPPGDFASAFISDRFIQVASDITKRILDQNSKNNPVGSFLFQLPLPLIAIHEFGHAFAGLIDEYIVWDGTGPAKGKNCAKEPTSEWTYNGVRYGDSDFEGCFFKEKSYRSSQASLMRGAQSGETRFNVVSCGYIIAAIKGGTGPEYWQECMNSQWNTIKPTSKTVSLGNILASLFSAFSGNKNLAAVGSAGESGQEILIERISADGTFTGEVLSVPAISYSSPPLADLDSGEDTDETTTPDLAENAAPEPEFAPALLETPPFEGRAASSETGRRDDAPASEQGVAQTQTPIAAGTKVRILHDNKPPARFIPLTKGDKLLDPLLCLSPEELQEKYKGDKSAYRAALEKQAKCAQNIAEATLLSKKIADTNASIATVQSFIDSLTLSAEETQNLSTLDNGSFVIFPFSDKEEKIYTRIGAVAMQCVAEKTAPVGTFGTEKVTQFIMSAPALAVQNDAVKAKIAKSHQLYLKESPKDKGIVISSTLDRLTALKETLNSNFILVTANAAQKLEPTMPAGSAIPLSVQLEKGADGKPIICPIGKVANFKLNFGGKDVLAAGNFLRSTVLFGSKKFEHDCVPEAYLLGELKTGVQKNIQYFEKVKAEYEAELAYAIGQLQLLEQQGYQCGTASFIATGGTPVRKSGVTPADRRAAAPQPPQSPLRGTGGEGKEPSYLIIESFDPNNPWGEIVEIVGDEEVTDEITRLSLVEDNAGAVTLFVDGATDAVGVKKGEEAEVKWKGDETIVSCRGSWSPANKLPASGAAKVVVNENSTITLLCLDTNGAATTKSVIVSAVNPPLLTQALNWLTGRAASSSIGTAPTVLTSCGEIAKSGKYVLDADLISSTYRCLSVHDVKSVHIDCKNHAIKAGYYPVRFENTEDFSLRSCQLVPTEGDGLPLFIGYSKNGEIINNKIGPRKVAVYDSSGLKIRSNVFNAFYQQDFTTGSTIEGNTFDLLSSFSGVITTGGAVVATYGSNNIIRRNNINGRADGLFSNQIGADDGIVLEQEDGAVVADNAIINNWDCGIETLGFISRAVISNNIIKNNGLCGIGGWYWSSWKGNSVSGNIVEDAPMLFKFIRDYGMRLERLDMFGRVIPADGPAYFKDNIFTNNTLVNPRTKGGIRADNSARFSIHATVPTYNVGDYRPLEQSDLVLGNNVFTNNDFTVALDAPRLYPFSMVVDGGGNICGKVTGNVPWYPLKCNQPQIEIARSDFVESSAGGLNLAVATPTISGASAGAGKLYASEMMVRAAIKNEGGLIGQTFANMWQYRDVAASGAWTDWVKFEVPGLLVSERADVFYKWNGGEGVWEFRLVADSGSAVAESNEQDNYSEPVQVVIVARAGGAIPPVPPPVIGGKPDLVAFSPVVVGVQTGAAGVIYEGEMKISAKVLNNGDASSGAFGSILQYSVNGRDFINWVRVGFPSLGPGDGSTASYSWKGGKGLWHFRLCADPDNLVAESDESEESNCSGPSSVEIRS